MHDSVLRIQSTIVLRGEEGKKEEKKKLKVDELAADPSQEERDALGPAPPTTDRKKALPLASDRSLGR